MTGERRQRLEDAAAALRSVGGLKASLWPARRLARYAEACGLPTPLVPTPARRWPALLRFVEPLDADAPLARLTLAALALTEVSAPGRRYLVGRPKAGWLTAVASVGLAMTVEVLAMPFRIVTGKA